MRPERVRDVVTVPDGRPLLSSAAPEGAVPSPDAAPRRLPRLEGRHRVPLNLVTIGGLLVAWVVVTATDLASPDVVPSPQTFAENAWAMEVDGYSGLPLHEHVFASARRAAIGFAAAIAVAVPVGMLMGYSRTVNGLLSPVFNFLRPIPAISFVPLVILYFGIGEFSKLFVIWLTTTLYLVVNVAAGVRAVPQSLLRVGRSLGLNSWKLFRRVVLPAALPGVITGLKLAVAISWTLVVAAELIAAQEGLGFIITDAATFGRVTDVYVAIVVIGLVGFSLEAIVSLLERRWLHWLGR